MAPTILLQTRCAATPEDSDCHVNVAPNGLYGQRCGSRSVELPAEWTRNEASRWTRCCACMSLPLTQSRERRRQSGSFSGSAKDNLSPLHACVKKCARRCTHARLRTSSLAHTHTAPHNHGSQATAAKFLKLAMIDWCLSARNGANEATCAARLLSGMDVHS